MNNIQQDIANYQDLIVKEFAAQYRIGVADAYHYLVTYGGFQYALCRYAVLRTFSPSLRAMTLANECRKRGGYI